MSALRVRLTAAWNPVAAKFANELPNRSRWLPYCVFLLALTYFGLFMPDKPKSDLGHMFATATTMARSGFLEGYAYENQAPPIAGDPRFTRVGGNTYTVYPKALEAFIAAPVFLALRVPPGIAFGCLIVLLAALARRQGMAIPATLLAAAFLVLFLLAVAQLALAGISAAHLSVVLLHTVLAAASIAMAFNLFGALGITERRALALTASLVVGSFWAYYSKAYTREIYYTLPIITALYFAVRRRFLEASVFLGLSMLTKYVQGALILPALLAYVALLHHRGEMPLRHAARNAATMVGVATSFFVMGKLIDVFYVGSASSVESIFYLRPVDLWVALQQIWAAVVGMTVSSGKGMLLYFPLSILLLRMSYRTVARRAEFVLLSLVLVLQFGFLAVFPLFGGIWSGDLAWGPRYLLLTTVPIAALVGMAVPGLRLRTIGALAVLGLAVNLPGFVLVIHANYRLLSAQQGVDYRASLFEPERSPTLACAFLIAQEIRHEGVYVPAKINAETFVTILSRIRQPGGRAIVKRSYRKDDVNRNYYATDQALTVNRPALVGALRAAGYFRYEVEPDMILWKLLRL